MLSRNAAVVGTFVTLNTWPIISLRFFLVNTSLIYPAASGTTSLNSTRPAVVWIILYTNSPFSLNEKPLNNIKNKIITESFKQKLSSSLLDESNLED